MDTLVVGVVDEVADGDLERTGQGVGLEEDPVLQGLMPALDLTLLSAGDWVRRGRGRYAGR